MKTITFLLLILLSSAISAQETNTMKKKEIKTEQEWKEILSPQEYYVLREKGTDRPGDGGYTKHFEKGTYHCAACDAQLFESGSKYESHCGWPSFDDAIKGTNCEGHLGHIFDDGPADTTGKRYCVNTTSIRFKKSE